MQITLTVPGLPIAKGRGRTAVINGHAVVYTPAKTRRAEATFASRVMESRPSEPLSGAIRVVVTCIFPVPKSWPKKQREAALIGNYQHITRPDGDNLLKLVKDSLNGLFWIDDKQVCDAAISKRYGHIPQTIVVISTLPHAA